jgi:hypothetical protein
MVLMIRRVGIMATRAWDFGENGAVRAASMMRPALRLAETPSEQKPMPPAWLIAPPFRIEPSTSVHEPQAAYRPTPTAPEGPYRTIREVPRPGSEFDSL